MAKLRCTCNPKRMGCSHFGGGNCRLTGGKCVMRVDSYHYLCCPVNDKLGKKYYDKRERDGLPKICEYCKKKIIEGEKYYFDKKDKTFWHVVCLIKGLNEYRDKFLFLGDSLEFKKKKNKYELKIYMKNYDPQLIMEFNKINDMIRHIAFYIKESDWCKLIIYHNGVKLE